MALGGAHAQTNPSLRAFLILKVLLLGYFLFGENLYVYDICIANTLDICAFWNMLRHVATFFHGPYLNMHGLHGERTNLPKH